MVRLKVIVEPKGPLVLGSGMDSSQNVRESRPFIAGSVVRGALAQRILQALGQHRTAGLSLRSRPSDSSAAEAFEAIFVREPVARFGYLYPMPLRKEGMVFPAPCTTFACKPSGAKHGWVDTLRRHVRQALFGRGEEGGRPFLCLICQERLERWRGFVVSRDGPYEDVGRIPRRPLVRVGLNRWTEAAEEEILYTLEAIEPDPQRPFAFVGCWTMTEDQWEGLKALLATYFLPQDGGYQLRLGSARARGLGEAILRWSEIPLTDPTEQVERFQLDHDHLLFTLTTRSPLLLVDERGIPASRLTSAVLRRYISPLPEGLELISQATFVEREMLTGWSQAWGLPKPVLPAIGTGSVFTYKVPIAQKLQVLPFLRALEVQGLGERRGEGLGEVSICDPFHVRHDVDG